MQTQFLRTLTIFRLALTFIGDYRKIRRIERRRVGEDRKIAVDAVYARAGARVRRAALSLQGLIIKVGQFASTRTDVLPTSFTRELVQLQDAVPGVSLNKIRPTIESELAADLSSIFLTFSEQPLAAASLGQVHQATLHDGQVVAVKVLRPGIERLARTDLSALRRVVWFVEKFTKFGKRLNVQALYREFRTMVEKELDYRKEAEHLRKFKRQFAQDERIVVPRLHDTLVSKRVLVMEFIDGAKISDVAKFQSWNVDPKQVVDTLLDAYLLQIIQHGLVHVDPHPGNLLVLADGRVCFLDFGMMSELPRSAVQSFSRLIGAALVRNTDGIVQSIDDLGFLQPHANRQFLKQAIEFILDRANGLELHKGPELDQFIEDFQSFLHEEPILIQANYMFLGRAVGILSGIISTLYPQIDWLHVLKERALPLITKQAQAGNDGNQAAWKKSIIDFVQSVFGDTGAAMTDVFLNQAQETVLSAIRLPGQMDRLIRHIEGGDISIRFDVREVLDRLDRQERLFSRVIWAGFSVAAGFSGVWLHLRHDSLGANISFAAMGVFVLVVLFNTIIYRRKRRPRHRFHGRS